MASHAAAKACEVVDAVRLYGLTAAWSKVDHAGWQAAGGAGFAVIHAGEDGLRRFLAGPQADYAYKRPEGPQAVFGRFYQWLAFTARDSAYDPLREVVRRHVIETMPVGPSDEVLGEPIAKRCLHSIRTASVETGRHHRQLRRYLTKAGVIGPEADGVLDALVLFDADAAAPVLAAAARQLGLGEAADYMNGPRVQIQMLAREGFIRPFVGAYRHRFAFMKGELDRFLAKLTRDAAHAAEADGGVRDIPGASRSANCRTAEIVQPILEQRLPWVGRRPGSLDTCRCWST